MRTDRVGRNGRLFQAEVVEPTMLATRVPRELLDRLDQVADRRQVSRSRAVVELLDMAIAEDVAQAS